MRPRDVRAEARQRPQRTEDRERLLLALHHHLPQRLVVKDPLRLPERLLRHRHPVHRRRPLQPRRRVDDITGDKALTVGQPRIERDDSFACVDADPDLQRQTGILRVQPLDRLENRESRPHRPLRVVLVRHGRAEGRHHRVADELLHGAAVTLDHLSQPLVVRPDPCPNVLRISSV